VSGNASFLDAVQINGSTFLNSVNISGNTTLKDANVSFLNVSKINVDTSIIYNPRVELKPMPDTVYDYRGTIDKEILNGFYIAPVNGFYRVDAYLNLTSSIRTTWKSSILTTNNLNVSTNYMSPFIKTTYFTQSMNETVKLNQGDKTFVAIYCGSNVSLYTTGSTFRTSIVSEF
jgi:hypothetical protein